MGADIMSSGLTESAEKIRREIKAMIPEDSEEGNLGKAETPPTTIDDGDVMYGGHNLAKKVSELMKVMEIDKVRNYLHLLFSAHTSIVDLDCGTIPQS